jgi:hypothetical protein
VCSSEEVPNVCVRDEGAVGGERGGRVAAALKQMWRFPQRRGVHNSQRHVVRF